MVGLGIDLKHPKLLQYIENQQRKRLCRAQEIAQKLDAIGFENTFDEVMKLAGHHNLSRSHFAHYLLNVGAVKTKQSAFKLYLGEGAPAYVMSSWLGLSDTIDLIHTLGGQAILAHPLHYKKSTGQLKALLREFKSLGGMAWKSSLAYNPQKTPKDYYNWPKTLIYRFHLVPISTTISHIEPVWVNKVLCLKIYRLFWMLYPKIRCRINSI